MTLLGGQTAVTAPFRRSGAPVPSGAGIPEEALFEAIRLATTETSIIATDVEGRITFVNRGAERMLGYAARELIGQTATRVHDPEELEERTGQLVADARADLARSLEAAIDGVAPAERRDWTYFRRDGSRLTVSLGVTVICDPAGAVLGYLGIAEDVTERRRGERLLAEARLQEAESSRRLSAVGHAKDQFISTVSHELLTPLTSLLGFAELLQDGDGGALNDQQSLLLGKVQHSALRLGGLLDQMIALARVGSDGFSACRDEVDLNVVVRDALAVASAGLGRRELHVEARLDPAALMVTGSADDLGLAVGHLLANAVKFTPDGGRITVSTSGSDTECFLTVADTGLGIALADQPELFDPFFRAVTAPERAIQGFGIGLSIVKAVVRMHAGDVMVVSEGEQGSAFVVRMPRTPPAPRATRSAAGGERG